MKTFNLVLEDVNAARRSVVTIEAEDFASAASEAYVQRHNHSFSSGDSWNILSLSERGWNVINIPKDSLTTTA